MRGGENMRCTNCGHELAENTQFCGSCGQRNDRMQQIEMAEKKDNDKNISASVIAFVGIAVGLGLGYFLGVVLQKPDIPEFVAHGIAPYLMNVLPIIFTVIFSFVLYKDLYNRVRFILSCAGGAWLCYIIQFVVTMFGKLIVLITESATWEEANTELNGIITIVCAIVGCVVYAVSGALLVYATSLYSSEKETARGTEQNAQEYPYSQTPNNPATQVNYIRTAPMKSPKSRGAALALCFFFGIFGIHRFYVGKIGTGVLWLLTGGLFGIGDFIDFFMLLFGTFKDADGLRL